ncbi:MAG: recombinase family protein [Deltaproteobacteria bacterium]
MRAALYARVSTVRQAEKQLSIPDQIRQMRDWCQREGYEVVAEFTDEGATATNDRRPEFQRMLTQAYTKMPPFDAIIVHSLSRFFRDHIELGLHDKNLRKNKVRLISITQLTDDDAHGELIRAINAVFDGYQSKETAKHTLRSLMENARQGYHNGSVTPYGFTVKATTLPGRRDVKKVLEIDPDESAIVRQIFDMYISNNSGIKNIASYLNEQNILRRGSRWNNTGIHGILTNRLYMGERIFNRHNNKTGELKPESEWIKSTVEAIIPEEVFCLVQHKLHSRSPAMSHPRRLSSPRLLTGILKCGICGANMTMATGSSPKPYYYYRCVTKMKQHVGLCTAKQVRIEQFDRQVLEALANKVFTPERVEAMMIELRQRLADGGADLRTLTRKQEALQVKLKNVYSAISNGIEVDQFFRDELDRLKQQEAEIAIKIATYQVSPKAIVDAIDKTEVEEFCAKLREELLDTSKPFNKEYLQLLVKEIILTDGVAKVSGGTRQLAGAIKWTAQKKNPVHSKRVIGFNAGWGAEDEPTKIAP